MVKAEVICTKAKPVSLDDKRELIYHEGAKPVAECLQPRKPGDKIAYQCPNCGRYFMVTVGNPKPVSPILVELKASK